MDPRTGVCPAVGIEGAAKFRGLGVEGGEVNALGAREAGAAAIDVGGADDGCVQLIAVLDGCVLDDFVDVAVKSIVRQGPDRVDVVDVGPDFRVEFSGAVGGGFPVGDDAGTAKVEEEGWVGALEETGDEGVDAGFVVGVAVVDDDVGF